MVDANLSILRERIEELRRKERLNLSYNVKSGWNYPSVYNHNYRLKRDAIVSESVELVGIISGTLGLVFLSGSLSLWVASLLFM